MAPLGKLLQRVQGLVWGDGVQDSSVYLDGHTVVADVMGPSVHLPALLVRRLDPTTNAPVELWTVHKDGAHSVTDLAVDGTLTVDGVDVGAALATAQANLLTNGGFEVWQRGAGPFTTISYTADRWVISIGGSSTFSVSRDSANADTGSRYCAACVYVHNAISTIFQQIEDFAQLRGRSVTFSVRVKTATANAVRLTITDDGGGTTGTVHSGGGAYETLTVTRAIPATTATAYVSIEVFASCTVYLDNATLVVGTAPLAYAPLHPAEELSRCLRYYEVIGGVATIERVAAMQAYATTRANGVLAFKVVKAGTPIVTVSSASSFALQTPIGAFSGLTALAFADATPRSCTVDATTGAVVFTAGDATLLFAVSGLNGVIAIESNP